MSLVEFKELFRHTSGNVKYMYVCACLYAQSCLTLCDLMDYSLPDSSVLGMISAGILECVAISSSKNLPSPEIESDSLALEENFFLPQSHQGSLDQSSKKFRGF